MKEIVIGSNFVGKSSLARFIRENNPDIKVQELDEQLIVINGGFWPEDRNMIGKLIPQVVQGILEQKDIIFFAGYISPEQIMEAKQKGFKIIQLCLDVDELKKRNTANDSVRELDMLENLKYQNEIQQLGLIDILIRVDKPINEISQILTNLT